jgi:hypothetical protein
MHYKHIEIAKQKALEEMADRLSSLELMVALLCKTAGVELHAEKQKQEPETDEISAKGKKAKG